MKKNITMKDIADYLGVDRTTISKALAGAPGVSPKTIEKVRQTAEQLGYRKDIFASGFNTGKNAVLGLLLADMTRGIYAPLVESFQRTALGLHYSTILFYLNRSEEELANAVELLKQQRVSGATFISAAAPATLTKYLTDFAENGLAVNTLERSFVERDADCVAFNHVRAGYDLTNHFIDLGHRNIAFMTYRDIGGTPQGRLKGYMEAMRGAGLSPRVIAEDNPVSHRAGDEVRIAYERLHQAWDQTDMPTGWIGVNDNFALGILHALKDKRIAVPGDMSVAGFDDLNATLGIPQLTSMRMPMDRAGEALAGLLVERISAATQTASQVTLDYEIIVRDSTAPCPPS
ncbi:LacI family DNA-binding transcriptional regulator [Paenibacillus oceani]|uniref:LacI family DNA-binding transcriptional regulator n=1 Tax=Paenibacillus oceani TaxID=2772510 RepID=A0A927H047_9BACL|nr:LacI family DNA-binding transcriptional regulator [Paenibacillus oceani]MBD2863330.1 LacI family DNA-binding transcriptional regulator [Paenibacillus oceani]